MQDKSSYKNYKKEVKDLKLRFITGRSQRQVPIFQWQGIGPARTGRSAAPEPEDPGIAAHSHVELCTSVRRFCIQSAVGHVTSED